jgi:hypothetical protein
MGQGGITATMTGGNGTGGAALTGGSTSVGGHFSTGGASGLGGSATTGGNDAIGGKLSNGGNGTGGSVSGGSTAAGGSMATGGRTSTGGSINTKGGSSSVGGNFGTGGAKIKGHTLVWHSQLAGWVNSVADVKAAMVNHITSVMTHFKSKLHSSRPKHASRHWAARAGKGVNSAAGNPATRRLAPWSLGASYPRRTNHRGGTTLID